MKLVTPKLKRLPLPRYLVSDPSKKKINPKQDLSEFRIVQSNTQ